MFWDTLWTDKSLPNPNPDNTMTRKRANELAWNDTTVEGKRRLLNHRLKEQAVLTERGEAIAGALGVISVFNDILKTANASPPGRDTDRWRNLVRNSEERAKEALAKIGVLDRDDWKPSDLEVIGAFILATNPTDSGIQYACRLFLKGYGIAKTAGNTVSAGLIAGKLVRAWVEANNLTEVENWLKTLTAIMWSPAAKIDPVSMSRMYQAANDGTYYLGVQYALAGGSSNQVMKAMKK